MGWEVASEEEVRSSRLLPWHPSHDVLGERAEPWPLPGHTPREWVI